MIPASDNKLKVVFAGTPEFAAYHLQSLIENPSCDVIAVYTQPDRPSGRGKKRTPSVVKSLALDAGLDVYQPESLKSQDAQNQLISLNADLMIVVAYGLLLPEAVLSIPRLGCLNVHGSLLPRWRGAAPIQRALAAGDTTSGITIMQMDKGLDTGNMLNKIECEISDDDTSATLHDKLMKVGVKALEETIKNLLLNQLKPEKQNNELATYAEKITKEEAYINWLERAVEIQTKVRAYNPFPIAYTFINETRIKIYKAKIVVDSSLKNTSPGTIVKVSNDGLLVACSENYLLITECQLPNKKPMKVVDILNGNNSVFIEGLSFEINNVE